MSTTSMAIFSNPLFATYSVYARNTSIGDAILPQTATKLMKTCVLNLALHCGSIWHCRDKPSMCTTTASCAQQSQKMFSKIYFLYNLLRTNLFIPNHFGTPNANFDNCCQHYISLPVRCGKNFFIQVHIYVLSPKVLQWNFFKSLSYLYEVVHTNFSAIFGLFTILDRNFTKIVSPSSDENENYVVHLKGNHFWKTVKTAWSTHKLWHNTCSNYTPRMNRTLGAW